MLICSGVDILVRLCRSSYSQGPPSHLGLSPFLGWFSRPSFNSVSQPNPSNTFLLDLSQPESTSVTYPNLHLSNLTPLFYTRNSRDPDPNLLAQGHQVNKWWHWAWDLDLLIPGMKTEYGFALIKQFLSSLFKLGVIFQILLEVRLTGIRSTSFSENVRETQSPPVLKILHRPVGFAGCCPAFGKGLFQMFLKKRNPLLLWCTWPDMSDLWGEKLSVHSQGWSLSPKVQVLIKDGWV